MRLKLVFGILAVTALGVSSCKKDKFAVNKISTSEWNPALAVPVMNSTITLSDLLNSESAGDLVQIDPNSGAISLVYSSNVVSLNNFQLVDLPNQQFDQVIGVSGFPAPIPLPLGNQVSRDAEQTVKFQTTAGVNIESVDLKSGSIQLDFTSQFQHDARIVLKIPGFKKNGKALVDTIDLVYQGAPPTTSNRAIPLTGYTLDLTNNGLGFNSFKVEYALIITGTGNTIHNGDSITIVQNLAGLEFSVMRGDIGQQTIPIERDTIDLSIFRTARSGYVEFTNPKLTLRLTNSFGFPAEMDIKTLETTIIGSGTTTKLSGFTNPAIIKSPGVSNIGGVEITNIEFNASNTANISSLFTSTPKVVMYEIDVNSNPGSTGSNSRNFLTDASSIAIDAEVELPLEGFAYGFAIQDTVNLALDFDVQNVKSVIVRSIVDNYLPIDARVQLVLLDENNAVLDSLFSLNNNLIAGGLPNANGQVTVPAQQITDFTLTGERIAKLISTKKIVIRGRLATTSQPDVTKLYDYYTIQFRLGLNLIGAPSAGGEEE